MTHEESIAEEWRELERWCDEIGLPSPEPIREQLSNYLDLLRFWAARQALMGAGEGPLLIRKHLADSLFAAARCPSRGRAADLGSGAGFPGIAVAIVRPELTVDLVESRAKKASFLTAAARPFPNARAVQMRIEDLPRTAYDLAVARALAPLPRLLPLARPLLRQGGELLAMKSASFASEVAAMEPSGAGFVAHDPLLYRLPTGEGRALLRFEAI